MFTTISTMCIFTTKLLNMAIFLQVTIWDTLYIIRTQEPGCPENKRLAEPTTLQFKV